MSDSPDFSIRNISIFGRFILAPMDGYTDSPMRRICKSFGSALIYSEFLNGIDITQGHPHFKTQSYFHESERPFVYQVYDDQPARFLAAALKLAALQPDIIDINLGCSARKVSNRGAGAGLLRNPAKIAEIASSLVKNLPIPVTAKIRLGWDESSENYLEISHILEDSGIAAIAVHARTRKQEYTGQARWSAIAEVKKSVSIPVIGNGDVISHAEGLRMLEETGCDAVMIGRAAIGNPWIFADKDRKAVEASELLSVITRHLSLMVELYGPGVAVPLFRKHLIRYLQEYLITPELRRHIFTITEPDVLLQEINTILKQK
jgi:nifR3 family TIM-barrel protein